MLKSRIFVSEGNWELLPWLWRWGPSREGSCLIVWRWLVAGESSARVSGQDGVFVSIALSRLQFFAGSSLSACAGPLLPSLEKKSCKVAFFTRGESKDFWLWDLAIANPSNLTAGFTWTDSCPLLDQSEASADSGYPCSLLYLPYSSGHLHQALLCKSDWSRNLSLKLKVAEMLLKFSLADLDV